MRKRLLSILLLCCMVLTLLPTAALAAGDVAIDETNFPDEKFREYVKTEFDEDNNNSLSADEIAKAKDIHLAGRGISSLAGVEHFTNLEELDVQHNEELTTLNLSKNTELKTLKCSNTKLTSLDTSHNKKLVYLQCDYIPTLTTLNVSENKDLKTLHCKHNALTALDLTNNSALEKLECGDNELTTLDLSKNTELKYFGCFNSKLSSLDLTNNTNLEELYFCGNNVSNIDVSENTKLKFLHLFSNQLITLDTSKNSNLQRLWVYTNPLTSMYLGDDSGSTMEVKFDNLPYPITVSTATKTFDLFQLTGFKVDKASDWTNGRVDGNILTVAENASTVTYIYDCGERQATYGNPETTGKLMMTCTLQINWEDAPDALTGTVNINGAPKFDETLTANVTDTNNTGTLTYQWYRAGKTDPIGTGETYTLVQEDIGKEITCRVSSSTETGTIQATVGPVQKADGPAAPVLELDFRSINIIKVKPLGNAYEYRIDNGEWQDLHYFENLQPGREYTITARAKETATHKPGAVSEPLTVATLFDMIPDDLKAKLTAVVSAYKAEYDGNEHEAVIVDTTKLPTGWTIAGHTAGTGDDFVSQIPKIRNVSGSNLTVKTKFTHPDYGQSLIVYSYPEVTPKPLTAGMIADIPPQLYTGKSIHPTPEIKHGDMVLMEGTDFTYSYETNTSPEQGGKVTINGKGNYKDTAFKTFTIVNEITEITEDDLKDLKIPTLVTVKCTTTNSSKEYGRIPGGFDLSKKPYMENGVWKAIVQLNLPAYKAKYDADTKKTHEIADLGGNLVTTFTLKYVNDKWELDGTFPNVIILVKCDGQHPQTPPYPTEENVSGLGDQIVAVLCNNVPTGQQSGKYYGLIGGGFTSTAPTLNADKVYESTITLIPSVYCNQFSGDTGIMHKVLSAQTTDGLKFVVKYDSSTKMWKPAEEVKQMAIWVTCDKHETPTPEMPMYPMADNISGLGDQIVAVLCNNVPTGQQSGKYYGLIGGGFTSTAPTLNADKVYESTITLIPSVYCNQFSGDTGIMHKVLSAQTTDGLKFVVKYDSSTKMWKPAEEVKQMAIWVTCDKHETPTPEMPMYPMADNISGLGDQIVAVLCNNVPTGQQSGKYYGLIGGGFTSTAPTLNADKVYESTITLIPSVYCNQFSGDTGIMHKVLSAQTTDGLKFVVKYDSSTKMWKPAEEVKQMAIWVTCDKHETDTPVPTEFTITFNGNGGTPSVGSMRTTNQKLTSLPTATRSGRYSFDGWYTAASGGTKITTATVFYENTAVYAHWTYIGGGGSSGGGGGYTYHTIRAIFGLNGSISPSGWTSVRHGWDQTFTITPDKGYAVAKVLVDGKSVGSVKSYTFKNVTKDHTIEVVFMKANGNPQTGVFVDVAEGSYYEEAVDWAVKNGITTGTGNNYFTPDGICTRAQAVTFLWRVAGSPTPKTEAMPFEDVLDGSYYYEAVLWAVENGITVGTSATTFSPELTCSRAHIVTFLWRAANSPSVKTDNPFTDVAADAYYIDAVLWAVKHKITVGTTLSTFSPDEGCTRAQIVTFLYRAHSK